MEVHTHEVDREEGIGPDYWGSIKIYQYCWCGVLFNTFIDSVF